MADIFCGSKRVAQLHRPDGLRPVPERGSIICLPITPNDIVRYRVKRIEWKHLWGGGVIVSSIHVVRLRPQQARQPVQALAHEPEAAFWQQKASEARQRAERAEDAIRAHAERADRLEAALRHVVANPFDVEAVHAAEQVLKDVARRKP